MLRFHQGIKYWIDTLVGLRNRRYDKHLQVMKVFVEDGVTSCTLLMLRQHLREDFVLRRFEVYRQESWIRQVDPDDPRPATGVTWLLTKIGRQTFEAQLNKCGVSYTKRPLTRV